MTPRATPMVAARIGALIVQVASAQGVHAATLMEQAGFAPDWLQDVDARMPLHVEQALWTLAAEYSADTLFGLHAAAGIRPGSFGVLDYAVRTAPHLGAALQRLARYNRLVHDLARFDIIQDGPTVRIEHRFEHADMRPTRHAVEFTLASLVVVASQISGSPLNVLAVQFSHAAPCDPQRYAPVLGTVPRFAAATSCLVLAQEQLHRAVPTADPALSSIVTAHAEHLLTAHATPPDTCSWAVRSHLADGLAKGQSSLGAIAQRMHMSERSLQRRLEAEGARFATLVEEVRRELAQRYIADRRLALGEVAYLLGFSEPSAFHRAFKRWTGMTPSAARKRGT